MYFIPYCLKVHPCGQLTSGFRVKWEKGGSPAAGRQRLAALTPPNWIGKLRPQVVLLSEGADDPRSQPDPETLQALEGYTLLRTYRNELIKLNTDREMLSEEIR